MDAVSDRSHQQIRFVTASDGVRIAVATTRGGTHDELPLVRVAHWLSHVEFDWESPLWRDFLAGLARDRTLVRYDQRGTGLSDRDVADLTFDAMVADLGSVVDAMNLERFALLGMSQGAAIGLAYAVRHPERVAALAICGGYARGHAHRGRTPEQLHDAELLLELIRVGWGTPNPKFRRVFATMFIPDGTAAEYEAFDELQRVSATPEVAYRLRRMFDGIDVSGICRDVRVPTLVMHVRDDGVVPFDEGRLLAALIPHSRFVSLDGTNHILTPGSPGRERFFVELQRFLVAANTAPPGASNQVEGSAAHLDAIDSLSARELDVMKLVAEGRTNAQIAEVLVLSPRTVERHLSNIYGKLGLEGKAARAAAAARVSRSLRD
jgi:pimeloyl-ACP methyl ester carboxylesterase/DNA-binding CsgD family transcriptional regulator